MPANADRYDSVAIALHWLIAALVAGMFVFGLLLDDWPRATKVFYVNIHTVVGSIVFLIVLFRLAWRLSHRPPELPANVGELSRKASGPVHWLIYVLLLAIPPIGAIAAIWHARVFNFGLFTIDFGVKSDAKVYPIFEDIHGYLVYALIALVALHALAALWHHFIRKDGVLLRMWPSGGA